MSHKIEDLGNEEWSSLSRAQQSRKAVPSHIRLCIFYGNQMPPPTPEDELSSLPKSTAIASPKRDVMPRETSVPVDVPTWTPMTATVSGPKFLSLSEREKGVIQKLHKNLGHPTAEKLARHMSESRALQHLSAGARDDNSDALRRAMHHQSRGMVHHWSYGQLCMYWDKRKSPNVLEKGRWCGPAQVICQESRTIIWINHMNRLLRCAKENIRPVSMREFQSHATFNQTSSQEQLQQMAKRLQEQLKSRSGLFQYVDLSQIPTEETTEDTIESPSHGSQQTNQPEEEPVRHTSLDLKRVAEQFATARETPVPDSPVSAAHEEPAEDQDMQSENNGPSTASLDTDHEEEGNDMEPVYNVTMVENGNHSDINLEDEETIWSHKDAYKQACVSFAFEMPRQQMCRFLKRPEEHFPCLVAAAKKSRADVVYNDLTPQEKEQFAKAKQKELKCWLDTDTVKAIMRERIHPSRIMSQMDFNLERR